MEQDKDLVIFKSISDFVKTLTECFGDDFINLQLYNRLIEKTTLVHKDAITKHVSIFKTFCEVNEDAIVEKDISKLKEPIVRYSEKVFVNIEEVFNKGDGDSQSIIWKHLLFLSAYFNKDISLKGMIGDNKESKGTEFDFIQNMMSKVESNLDDNVSNPMDAISSMMSNGVFGELVNNMTSGLQNGELNIGSLMGTVNEMVNTISPELSNMSTPTDNNKKKFKNKKKKPKRR
jgi:hypothetical protein